MGENTKLDWETFNVLETGGNEMEDMVIVIEDLGPRTEHRGEHF